MFSLENSITKQFLSKDVGGRKIFYLFIHQLFIEPLLCARHNGHVKAVVVDKADRVPALMELLFILVWSTGRTIHKGENK